MVLRKKGKYHYGDSQFDIESELARYSGLVGYSTNHYTNASCVCGKKLFNLKIDDDAGVAIRTCAVCGKAHLIGDSGDYFDESDLEECGCPCGSDVFEITAGVALYENSEDVKWFYLGCRCKSCGLTACYGDWKNEYTNFRELLKRV